MSSKIHLQRITELCGCESITFEEIVQSLWSGYGEITRVRLSPSGQTVIVKYVDPPDKREHKYGWAGQVSHDRKLSSYDNELQWYSSLAEKCGDSCRVPLLIEGVKSDHNWLMVMEDLDESGYPIRRHSVDQRQLDSCLAWLAGFHATFLHDSEKGVVPGMDELWPVGTYWHLATRPEEYDQMPDSDLKKYAGAMDQRLNACRYQTLVHGDAKLANFCFSKDDRVAAVDFQYVGRGCGIKDVAYFISSCFDEAECEQREEEILNRYFSLLREYVGQRAGEFDMDLIEEQWRELYAFAWADFYRFLAGWSPGHRKMHRYSKRLTDEVIAQIDR